MNENHPTRSPFFHARGLAGAFIASMGILLGTVVASMPSGSSQPELRRVSRAAERAHRFGDGEAQVLEKRQKFLEAFFGRGAGGVSPSEYASALSVARALPRNPFLNEQKFAPQTAQTTWSFPIPPPITNSYGADASAQIHSIAIDPTNANIVYTGSFGGLAQSTDGGSTWRYLSDDWASQSVTSIAVDYNAISGSKFIYVGTGREDAGPYGVGIYRSSDNGATWSGPFGTAQFAGTAIVAIATTGTRSVSDALYVVNKLGPHPPNPPPPVGLWRSTDSGVSWTQLRAHGGDFDGYTGVFDVAILGSSIFITEEDGVFRSTDSGQTWNLVHTVPAVGGARAHLGVDATSSTVYLMQQGDPTHNFYKSGDGGQTWVQIPTHCPAGASSCAGTEIGFDVFAVNPRNPSVIVAGGYGGVPYGNGTISLFRTTDEGVSWKELGPWYGPIHADHHAIAFAMQGSVVYEGNDGGIIKSSDAGSTWTNLNHNLSGALLYSVALGGDGSMIAGSQDNGAVYSNLGAPWNAISGGDSSHDLIDPVGTTWAYFEYYIVQSISRYNRTTGEVTNIHPTQLEADRSCDFFPAFSMNPSLPTHLLAGCEHLVRTLDATTNPVTWTTIGQTTVGGGVIIDAYEAPSDANVIYAITAHYDDPYSSGSVYLTTNANSGNTASWTSVTPPLAGHLQAVTVDPTNAATAYVAGTKAIYKTTDMGGSWRQIGIPNLVYHDVAIEPTAPNWIYVASNAGVLSSTDGGVTWANMSDGIPSGMAVTSLSLNRRYRTFNLVASTYGRGVYSILLPPPRQ